MTLRWRVWLCVLVLVGCDEGAVRPPVDGPVTPPPEQGSVGREAGVGSEAGTGLEGGVLPTTSVIPEERRVVWAGNVGIPGGVPARSTVCATVDAKAYGTGTADATTAIQNALNSCPQDQVVFLPAGTYKITKTISVGSHRVLRGAGPGSTTISYQGPTGGRTGIALSGSANLVGGTGVGVVSGATKGSKSITVASLPAGVAAGSIMLIDQLNDGKLVDADGVEGKCTYCGRANGDRVLGQLVEVTGVNDKTVSFNIPLYWTYTASLQPQAVFAPQKKFVRWAGVEDLKLTQPNPSVTYLVELQNTQFCWLKNVEVTRVDWRAVWIHISLQSEVRESYFHVGINGYGRSHGYGVLLDTFSSGNLVENNMLRSLDGGFIMAGGGAAGNVVAYNYMIDSRFDDEWWLTSSPSMNHAPHPMMNLFEGNVGYKAEGDFIHGSSSHTTLYRSRSMGWQNATATSANNAVQLAKRNNFYNVVGCVLGTEGKSTRYEVLPGQPFDTSKEIVIWALGVTHNVSDPEPAATLLRHGNYDHVSKKTIWDPKIASQTLPPSLYLSSKPAWFGSVAWPPIGPDVTGLVQKIPAQLRFEALP